MLERLEQQMQFILEIDKVKKVVRRNLLTDGTRYENDAEHSWHLAVMAFILLEHVDKKEEIELLKVIKMVVIHDLVEIDAGDTYCYDEIGIMDQHSREVKAAERIFSLLPPDQTAHFRDIWDEFEEGKTPEAQFAAMLDRMQPVLLNYTSEGRSWRLNGITRDQVLKRNARIKDSSQAVWDYVVKLIDQAVEKGYLNA